MTSSRISNPRSAEALRQLADEIEAGNAVVWEWRVEHDHLAENSIIQLVIHVINELPDSMSWLEQMIA